MSNGNAIGAEFERLTSRILSKYATGQCYDRSPMRDLPIRRINTAVTPVGLEGKKGDTGAIHKDLWFPFAVECKRYKNCEIEGMFTAKKWLGWDHWEQACRQVTDEQPIPMLLFNRPRKPVYCMMPERYRECLQVHPTYSPVLTVHRQGDEEAVMVGDVKDVLRVPLPALNRRLITRVITSSRT